MVKRVVSLLAAVFMVCASSFSASAWDADSFVADSPNYYKMFPARMPSISTMADQSQSLISLFTLSESSSWMYYSASYYFPETEVVPGLVVGGYSIPQIAPPSGYRTVYAPDSSNITIGSPDGSSCPAYQPAGSDDYLEYVDGVCFASSSGVSGSVPVDYFDLDMDISSFGDFSVFSFDGSFVLWCFDAGSVHYRYGGSVQLFVNGAPVHTFNSDPSGVIDFASFIYDASVPVTSLMLRVSPSYFTVSVIEGSSYDSAVAIRLQNFVNVTFDVLSGDTVLDGYTDEAQDSINQHDQIEADWVGQMDENFNSLDLDTASYPSGLVSGFQLLSGIFMDIWKGLGDLHLIFTIPLTLGIVLVLIGRISKAVSNRSGRAEEKGDNSA